MDARPITASVKDAALSLGFDAVGVARVESLENGPDGDRLRLWIAEGRHGQMGYLERGMSRRLDPCRVMSGTQSIISVALSHWSPDPADPPPVGSGDIARYARGRDYHKVFDKKLKQLEEAIVDLVPGARTRRYADTGPVLEKLWAQRAGLGWRGKHTNLVSRELGSWFLLGELLTDLPLIPDDPETDYCGTCSSCIDVCPTKAIVAPYRLDANLCVSYLTIEHRGSIPKSLRPGIGARVFGCDDCLAICPWNKFALRTREADFRPRPEALAPLLAELIRLDEKGFYRRFAGTAVTRAKRAGLARNACVALGNTGTVDAVPVLREALNDDSPLVREHAAWALGRIGGSAARAALEGRSVSETDPEARAGVIEAIAEIDGR